jgi:hypothetical protein
MNATIDTDRLASVTKLYAGSHAEGSDEKCIMEAVAFVTHKKWSDEPPCVCPVLAIFMRSWNDGLNDAERALLLPFIPKLINTRGTVALERRRRTVATDWLIRVYAPAWLRLAKLDVQADLLAALPEITHFAQCPSLMPTLTAVRQDALGAWEAVGGRDAGAAARDAARESAWVAAREAAGDAARDAAWGPAADAAWDAAKAAARVAAWKAISTSTRGARSRKGVAWDALNNTRLELQSSAVALVERMIAVR